MEPLNRKSQPITEPEFNFMKGMLDRGVTAKEVTRQSGRGAATIWIVKKSEDFEDYKQNRANYNNQPVKKEPVEETVSNAISNDLSHEPSSASGRWRQLTEEGFNRMKALDNLDVPKAQISKLVKKSYSSTSAILKHNTWADYQAHLKKLREDRQAKEQAKENELVAAKPALDMSWADETPTPRPPNTVTETQTLVDQMRQQFAQVDETFRKLGY